MITKQHIALTTWAMLSKGKTMDDVMKAIPYAVLPDAIRMYVGQRQPSHFEKHPSGRPVSWMVFPEGERLKNLNKENANVAIKWHIAENIPAAVIGEETDLDTFKRANWPLKNYHEIRTHLVQDVILDTVLRETMIDASGRFEDVFTVRHTGRVMNGKELRTQVSLFEELGFIKLVGLVFENTGVLLDKEWFDTYVQKALYDAYPEDMAHNTYRFMKISEDVDQWLRAHNFELTQEEKDSVYMAENLDAILDAMYAKAFKTTCEEF